MVKGPYKRHPMSRAQVIAYAAKNKKRRSIVRGIVAAVAACVFVSAGAAAAYYSWFISSLNGVLGQSADQQAANVLSERADFDEPFYMLLLASDARAEEHDLEADQQTDVMLLARIDAKNRQVTLLSIPRDTRYVLDDGSIVKMNGLYNIGGMKKTIEGVSELTGLPISHYAMVYVSDCENVVDELGGVEIDVEHEIVYKDRATKEKTVIEPGLQMLDGHQARVYANSRHDAVGMGEDAYRQLKVRTLIKEIVNKLFDRPPYEVPGMVIKLANYVITDLTAEEMVDLAVDFATGSGDLTVYQASGPADGGLDEESGMWLCYENPEGWAEVTAVVDAGGDPSTVEYDGESESTADGQGV